MSAGSVQSDINCIRLAHVMGRDQQQRKDGYREQRSVHSEPRGPGDTDR